MSNSFKCVPERPTKVSFYYHDSNWNEAKVESELLFVLITVRAKNDSVSSDKPKYYGQTLTQLVTKDVFHFSSSKSSGFS